MADTYLTRMLGDKERIVHVARQHWLVLAGEILSETVLSLALIVLVTLVLVFAPMLGPLVALGYLLLIFPLLSLTRDVLIWSNRQYVVTTRRVIHVVGVFSKNVIDSSLEKVNDVKMTQTALGRILGYGNVEILTASELGVNLFSRIADPVRFKTAMLNAKEQLERGTPPPAPKAAAPQMDVPALIIQLDALRKQGMLTEAEFQSKKAELLAKL